MFERLKRLYNQGKIGEPELDNAVAKCWITEEQKMIIMMENEEGENTDQEA